MKNKKYLPLYYEWMETKRLPIPGLCPSLEWCEELYLFKPENELMGTYWANTNDKWSDSQGKSFNKLRQNIVLLLAAMNGEL